LDYLSCSIYGCHLLRNIAAGDETQLSMDVKGKGSIMELRNVILSAIVSLPLAWTNAYGHQQDSNTPPGQQANPYLDKNSGNVPNLLEQSLGSINECYRGMHPYFGADFVATLLSKAEKSTWAQLGDTCRQLGGGSPDISISIGPVSVPSDKVCYAITHARCVPN
jgi:hypothetical protein